VLARLHQVLESDTRFERIEDDVAPLATPMPPDAVSVFMLATRSGR